MFPASRSFAVLATMFVLAAAALAQDAPAASAGATPAGKASAAKEVDQAAALEKTKQDIEAGMKQYYVPGAALAIIKNDKVILLTGLGYKDLKNNKPVTTDTLFAIGSTTKAFTSMLMAMAADEG